MGGRRLHDAVFCGDGVASFVPLSVFRWPGVCRAWRDALHRGASAWRVIFCALPPLHGLPDAATVDALARRLPRALPHLALDLSYGSFGEAGARAVADRLPTCLRALSLVFARTNVGDGGAE